MLSFFRVFRFALQDMVRNLSLSFMTILILVLMLLSVNTVIMLRVLTHTAIDSVKEQIDLSVHFRPTASDVGVAEVERFVDSLPVVTSVETINRTDVLTSFQEKHADNSEILASIEELDENPFGPSMIIKASDPSEYTTVIEALTVPEYDAMIERKTYADTKTAIDRIAAITVQVEQFVFLLSGLFGVIAFLVVFNTIRVTIYTQREEISIKKLVGATNWFVRGPYIIQAFFFTVLSVGLAGAGVAGAVYFLDPYIATLFGQPQFLTDYLLSNIILFAGAEFVSILVLTTFTSMLAMRRYLKK